jgi:hypothetical protein
MKGRPFVSRPNYFSYFPNTFTSTLPFLLIKYVTKKFNWAEDSRVAEQQAGMNYVSRTLAEKKSVFQRLTGHERLTDYSFNCDFSASYVVQLQMMFPNVCKFYILRVDILLTPLTHTTMPFNDDATNYAIKNQRKQIFAKDRLKKYLLFIV